MAQVRNSRRFFRGAANSLPASCGRGNCSDRKHGHSTGRYPLGVPLLEWWANCGSRIDPPGMPEPVDGREIFSRKICVQDPVNHSGSNSLTRRVGTLFVVLNVVSTFASRDLRRLGGSMMLAGRNFCSFAIRQLRASAKFVRYSSSSGLSPCIIRQLKESRAQRSPSKDR